MRASLSLLLAVLSSTAAFASQTPETPLADARCDAPAGASRYAVADDGAYVVWTDQGQFAGDVYQMRLSANGEPRIETRQVIGRGAVDDALAVRGDHYAVFSSARLTTIRRSDGAEQAQIENGGSPARLSWNGSHFLIVYARANGNEQVAQLLDEHLRTIGSPITIGFGCCGVAVKSVNGSFLVAWSDPAPAVHIMRIDDDGSVTSSSLALPTTRSQPLLAIDGSRVLLAWSSPSGHEINGALLSASGESIGEIMTIAQSQTEPLFPVGAVASNGAFAVGWIQNNTFLTRSLDGGAATVVTTNATAAQLTGNAGTPFAAWMVGSRVFGRLLDHGDAHVITRGPADQLVGSIATDGFDALSAWTEEGRVRVGRIGMDGTRFDGAGLLVADGEHGQSSPQVAFDGTNFLVVWIEKGMVKARFLSRQATFDSEPMEMAAAAERVAVAWLGDEYLVAWSGAQAGAATVTANGIVTPLAGAFGADRVVGALGIARSRRGALIVYGTQQDDVPQPSFTPQITTISTLLLRDEQTSERHVIAAAKTGIGGLGQIFLRTPRVASDDDTFLVGWTQQNGPGRGSEAYLVRLDGDGNRIDPALRAGISYGSSSFPPATATPVFDGAGYQVISVDYPSLIRAVVDDNTFICGCLIKETIVTVSSSLPVSFLNVAVAAATTGKVFVAYDRGVTGQPIIGRRVRGFARLLGVAATPPRRRAAR